MTALGRIERMVNAVLAPLTGHVLAHEGIVPSFERFARRLVAAGPKPRTVFDIGVAEGTPWPRATFVAERGFGPLDLIGVYRRDRDDALIDLELAFAPADSPLRADRRWAG